MLVWLHRLSLEFNVIATGKMRWHMASLNPLSVEVSAPYLGLNDTCTNNLEYHFLQHLYIGDLWIEEIIWGKPEGKYSVQNDYFKWEL